MSRFVAAGRKAGSDAVARRDKVAELARENAVLRVNNARIVAGSDGDIGLYVFFGEQGQWVSMHVDIDDGALVLCRGNNSNDFTEAETVADVVAWLREAHERASSNPRKAALDAAKVGA